MPAITNELEPLIQYIENPDLADADVLASNDFIPKVLYDTAVYNHLGRPLCYNALDWKRCRLCSTSSSSLSLDKTKYDCDVPKNQPVPDEAIDAIATIVDVVRRGHARSRSEIIERTGLSRAVVMQRVNDLIVRGFIVESDAPSTGGRPPRQLEFRADAGYLLVADLGATSIDVAVADLAGRILARSGEPAVFSAGPDIVLSRVEAMFDRLIEETKPSGDLWGMGIGVPEPVEFKTGRPSSPAVMPGWDDYPVREHFTERRGVPIWVDNDVNIMALGELRAGAARAHANFIFVKVGTGIGSGIISNGLIHRGAKGSAGDIGHVRVAVETQQVCRCGNIGCLEALAGGGAIGREGTLLAQAGRSQRLASVLEERGSVTAQDVRDAASMGDAEALELLQLSGRLVGQTLAGLVDFFNPSLILIGGGVANAGDAYLATIRQVVYGRSAPMATRDLLVQLSRLGQRAGVTGAASMVLDQLFSAEYLGRWIDKGQPAGMEIAAA